MSTKSNVSDPRLPRYQQIRDDLAEGIARQTWSQNQTIPTEAELSQKYAVAIGTIRQAVDLLISEGLVERLHGKGTFVRRPTFSSSLFRFFRHKNESGDPIMPSGKVLSRELADPPEDVARALQLTAGQAAITMNRIRTLGGQDVLREEIWLPAHRFDGFLDLPASELEPLLYPAYEANFGVLVTSAEETLSVESADVEMAKMLGVKAKAPLMVIERCAYDQNRDAVEWRRSYGSATGFRYKIEVR